MQRGRNGRSAADAVARPLALALVLVSTLPRAAHSMQPLTADLGNEMTCDNVPEPFGSTRSKGDGFGVICGPNMEAMLSIGEHEYRIDSVSVSGGYVVIFAEPIAQVCYDGKGNPTPDSTGTGARAKSLDGTTFTWSLEGTPFTFSKRNKLVNFGCHRTLMADFFNLSGDPNPLPQHPSCTTACTTPNIGGSCLGEACCEASMSQMNGAKVFSLSLERITASGTGEEDGTCSAAFFLDKDEAVFNFSGDEVRPLNKALLRQGERRMILDWAIGSTTCGQAQSYTFEPLCKYGYDTCVDAPSGAGYLCKCPHGYDGNPYASDGCQDIDECRNDNSNDCIYQNLCNNTLGGYTCSCPKNSTGDGYRTGTGCNTTLVTPDIDKCENPEAHSCYGICQNLPGSSFRCLCHDGTYGNPFTKGGCITIKKSFPGLSIGLGVGGGTSLLLLALGGPIIMRRIKQWKVKKMRHKFFKENHGLLLQQLISRNIDIGQRMIIALTDLEKATDNFDRARIVGGGGHGVVFKGILDLQVVAIKKSKIIVQREIDDFINEVVVLSQVNHRNVVKLLGCCLESKVPLLVYEFISNGTLYSHLHVEGPRSLSWEDRLRISTEVAKALSYLHSSASMPIFHRDVKSSNILLDDALTAKVSDFGASRYIPIDQTGVFTAVQGTFGYLDPMYYYTGRLTDKSDVFSFGVVLVELLTRKKPNDYQSVDGDSLVSHFVSLLAEGKLDDIIDHQVLEEEKDIEVQEVATLAAMCIKLKGEDRPTMMEVEMTLQNFHVKRRQDANTQRNHDDDNTMTQYMSTEQANNEASRQYTMEEEMLFSASFQR